MDLIPDVAKKGAVITLPLLLIGALVFYIIKNDPISYFKSNYLNFFTAVAIKSAINPISLLKLSYDITNGDPKLIKFNNFFAVKSKNSNVFHKYNTPFDGITAGLDVIKNHPDFEKTKIATLKANEKMQYEKLRNLLKL